MMEFPVTKRTRSDRSGLRNEETSNKQVESLRQSTQLTPLAGHSPTLHTDTIPQEDLPYARRYLQSCLSATSGVRNEVHLPSSWTELKDTHRRPTFNDNASAAGKSSESHAPHFYRLI